MGSHERKRFVRAAWLLALFVLAILFLTTKSDVTLAGNESSRLAAVQSIVDRGTFQIDESIFQTVDKVRIDGHFYSDKPPLLTLWLAGIYGVLHFFDAISFEHTYSIAVKWVTFLGVGSFAAALGLLFFFRLRPLQAPLWMKWLGAAAVVLTTWIFSYAGTVNNHTPAAAVLFALVWAVERARASKAIRPALVAGLLAGALFNLDLPTGAIFCLAGGIAIWLARPKDPRALAGYGAGFAALLLVFLALNLLSHGSPLPAYMAPGGQDFAGNIHSAGMAGLRKPENYANYLWEMLLGNRGLFSYMPALLFALPAFAKPEPRQRQLSRVFATAVLATVLFYGTETGDFGGWAYGFRFLIPLVPLLFWTGFLWMLGRPRGLVRGVFFAALSVGLLTSALGAYNPWPVVYEGASTEKGGILERVQNPLLANLLSLSYEKSPNGPLTRWLLDEVYGKKVGRSYLVLAYTNTKRVDLLRQLARDFPP